MRSTTAVRSRDRWSADNARAATIIRAKAAETGNALAHEKLADIVKALGVVLRRYGVSRNQRRAQKEIAA